MTRTRAGARAPQLHNYIEAPLAAAKAHNSRCTLSLHFVFLVLYHTTRAVVFVRGCRAGHSAQAVFGAHSYLEGSGKAAMLAAGSQLLQQQLSAVPCIEPLPELITVNPEECDPATHCEVRWHRASGAAFVL